jgi:DNA-binding MarR family transcriptional regulator
MGFAWNSFSVMKSILPRESVTLTEISIRTSKDSSNVTSIIDSLEDKGIIRRVSDKSDRRVIRIELTEKGIDIRNKVIEEHNSFIRDSFENVPEGMLKEFNDMLEGMSEFI